MSAIAHKPFRGLTDDWITPPALVRELGEFDLDPCECEPQPWHHAFHGYSKSDDGLNQPWNGRVWLNPPYGPVTGVWLAKLADHGNGIALVQARIETDWFFDTVWNKADSVFVMRKRPTFFRPDGTRASGNSGGPCVLVAYGQNNVEAIEHSPILGKMLRLGVEGQG